MSACLFIGFSSALLLYYVVGWLTSWHTLELQDVHREIAKAVDLDVTQVARVLRIVLLGFVVVLVSGVVGAIYAARGHLGSRILVTVVAASTAAGFVVAGGLFGLLPGVFAVAAIFQLWSRDSNRWFAVVNGREVSPAPVAPAPPPVQDAQDSMREVAPPPPGWSVPPGAPPAWVRPDARPSSVGTALLVTAIAAATAIGGSLLYLLVYVAIPHDQIVQAQLDSSLSDLVSVTDAEMRQALTTTAVFCAITVVLGAAALLAAWSLSRRGAAGHTALFVLSVVTIIVGTISIVGLPWAGVAVWVVVLLRRPATLRWLSERPSSHPPR